ncbi:NAD+ synthase [Zavarzinia compransoris]|uniref:Glutamine-dependent NAD(+) synthetase n=1 Tax=Zavarzinia compransoris TaxID=1264899 RepID=A0A317EE55_9PROT|nr:NAD+ synthase [Zavarzinia compransoris]PWR23633.1 NAD+ synthase [Zavarzinia compransoris]
MTDRLRLTLAQIDFTVGDIAGNVARILAARDKAAAAGADLLVTSELSVTGYPPEDLVLKPAFVAEAKAALARLAAATADGGPALLVGAPWATDEGLFNAVFILDGGGIAARRDKVDLPNYGVFDEKRVFRAGALPEVVEFRGVRLGLPICEDIWTPAVTGHLAARGAEIMIVPNGSPFEAGKDDLRLDLVRARVAETGVPLIYLNQVGGQDELVFDGASFAVGADGTPSFRLPAFEEALATMDWRRGAGGWGADDGPQAERPGPLARIYGAMVLGLRDYVNKNRFPGVVLGLSGGIDSAISAAVAVDALGPERVWCVMLPSRYTSPDSLEDAALCAGMLGVRLDEVGIEPAVEAFSAMLGPVFAGRKPDITEENIQSRARGLALMAISNKFGHMVLTTGNKSEVSVGYATLYGDMCGGYSVLKDLYKTTVFALSRWRNENRPAGALGPAGLVMPERIITKPPTAELRENQKDQDSLPPYEVLDDILEALVEGEMAFEDVVARGHDPATVRRIEHLLYVAEYKRRQAAPGVKIGRKLFGRDRRYPITNGFRDAY